MRPPGSRARDRDLLPVRRKYRFLIVAPPYTHRSSGIRALYRLCHHLNQAGYPAAIAPFPRPSVAEAVRRTWRQGAVEVPPGSGQARRLRGPSLRVMWDLAAGARRRVLRAFVPFDLPPWDVTIHRGPPGDAIVIYPEVVSGNPLHASRVVRWVLNSPGLLGGDASYPDSEMVFVYDARKLPEVNAAVQRPIGAERVLWMGLIDPAHIYPDATVPKVLDCSFTHKGRALGEKFPLEPGRGISRLEELTPDMAALGTTLRRTRTLYSYDHYSNVLREAAICGCAVRVPDARGRWHDPEGCDCPLNIHWAPGFRDHYAAQFHDGSFVSGFVERLRERWEIPPANPTERSRTPRAPVTP